MFTRVAVSFLIWKSSLFWFLIAFDSMPADYNRIGRLFIDDLYGSFLTGVGLDYLLRLTYCSCRDSFFARRLFFGFILFSIYFDK